MYYQRIHNRISNPFFPPFSDPEVWTTQTGPEAAGKEELKCIYLCTEVIHTKTLGLLMYYTFLINNIYIMKRNALT